MKNIFREYDIRGIFREELNKETVYWIGHFLGKRIKKHGEYVAVGYDARVHSVTLFQYLSLGLNSAGVKIMDIGLIPTPVTYFVNHVSFNGGIKPSGSIMITGSHNPPEYNGFKITINKEPFFGNDIYKLGEEVSQALAKNLEIRDEQFFVSEVPAKESYIDYLVKEFKALKNFNQKIVYDVGNGVAGVVLTEIFRKLRIDANGLFIRPDGTFPNHHPDPTEEKNLIDIKRELNTGKYSVGFAYDGDADRIAVLTQRHSIKGDVLALILSKPMINPIVIGEVKCSQIMYDLIEKRGGTVVMYKTGHSNLKVKIKELEADLAAEVSGHIFFNDRYFGFDDAIYTTLRVMELMNNGTNLDDEVDELPKTFSTEEIKTKTSEDKKFSIVEKLKKSLNNPPANFPKIKKIIDVDGVRVVFENGWGLVRASNTTPVLVSRFEANSEANLQIYQNALFSLLKSLI